MNSVRSYADSYLYTRIPDYERSVFEFVMKSERIDKHSDTFTGVIDDVKRRQTSAVLSRVLMRDDVVLCVNNKPLPAAFKVFAAKDVKTDQSVKVFIDLSGLITLKNGYYVINKIDIFCSYLLSAMTNIVYNENTAKICSNSMIIQNGTECFVDLSSHIFDYLRANGYSENKNKIAYIFAMYFQCTILGLNREDSSVKNLAAKISGIPSRDINAMEIYYDDSVLTNINTLVTCVSDTFKMKGVGTDTFVEKWTWFYGVGTQFGTELFPAFSSMITDAYCGAYVNNQKTIEKCCGRAMVNFTTTMLRLGEDTIESGFRYESSIDRESYDHNKSIHEAQSDAKEVIKKNVLTDQDIVSISKAIKKYNNIKKGWAPYQSNPSKSMSNMAQAWLGTIMATANYYVYPNTATPKYKEYKSTNGWNWSNQASSFAKVAVKDLSEKDKEPLIRKTEKDIHKLEKDIKSDSPFNSGTDKKEADKVLKDFKAALKILDPGNAAVKEYVHSEDDDKDNCIEEIAVAEDGVLICESQKFMGYGGTTKVEKKYNIPEQYCIEREDIMNFKKSDSVVKKAEQAVKKIKDPDDVMKYFKSLFKSLCFWGSITSIEQVRANANVNKIWKLWNSSYKGDKMINPGPTFAAIENLLPAGTVVSAVKNGGVETGNMKTTKGFLSVFKPKKKKKK